MNKINKQNNGLIIFSLLGVVFSVFLGYIAKNQFELGNMLVSLTLAGSSIGFLFWILYTSLKLKSMSKVHDQSVKEAFKYDTLTQLPNSNYFRSLIENKKDNLKKEGTDKRLYLIKIGFERFKFIQDNFGLSFAEQLFIDISKELVVILDEEDELSRLEGEGFIFVTLKKENEILEYLIKINNMFNKTYSPSGMPEEIYISIKMGVSVWDKDLSNDYDEITKRSNSAYSHAINQSSKDFYKIYSKSIQAEDKLNVQLEQLLREAVRKEEIIVHFQPKIGLDGKVKSAEALARWFCKELEQYIRPDIFINTAEDIGIIEEVGKHIMERSIKELKKWHDNGYTEMKIAVNVSTKQFNRELPVFIKEMLDKYKVKPELLEIEVTESALVTDKHTGTDLLHKIRDTGAKIAIDDFGTGYSSLSYLVDFPLDVVKIDKSFIDKIIAKEPEMRRKGEAVVSTIIHLSHKLGCIVVAEGVEELSQLQFLQKEKCDLIQGYYYSKPLSKEDFIEYLKDNY